VHADEGARSFVRAQLAETSELCQVCVDLSLAVLDLSAKRRAARVFHKRRYAEGQADRVVALAERALQASVLEMERSLAVILTPWLDRQVPSYELASFTGWARQIAVLGVGFDKATKARKRAGAPLVCLGNTRAKWPETWHHGVRGCARVYHGQWRQAREQDDVRVAVGPRCPSCNARIGEDRRQAIARATQHLS
jgi:hypothetical protein